MQIPFKFTAKVVDQIEKNKKQPIEAFLGDTSVANLAYLIEKGHYDEETEKQGVSNERSLEILGEYLADGKDKEDLLIDFMEALQETGFLSRKISTQDMRKALESKGNQMQTELKKVIEKTES